MAERLTRGEHIAHAQRMVVAGAENYSEARSDKDREMARDLIQASLAHATIALALGQQPAEPVTPVRPWIPDHRGYWQYGPWALIASGPGGVPSSSGWYLFGPGLGNNGAPMGTPDFAEAQRAADVHIDAWLSEPTS